MIPCVIVKNMVCIYFHLVLFEFIWIYLLITRDSFFKGDSGLADDTRLGSEIDHEIEEGGRVQCFMVGFINEGLDDV